MIKTTTIVIIAILSALLIYLYPRQAINPGDLIKGHQHLENDCLKCHTLFSGTPAEKCVACHKPADIGRVTTEGVIIEAKPGQQKAAFHHLFSADTCLSCHPDHKGRDIGKAGRRFSHDLLQGVNMKQCTACHKGPADNLHAKNSQECSQCHSTERWRPAAFDHAQYFRFDGNHPSDCRICHKGDNFKEYTCYGCHAHSPGKTREEHLEEGISNYQDCAACHPSGNEHDIRRLRHPLSSKNGFSGEPSNGYEGSSRGPESRFNNGLGDYSERYDYKEDEDEVDDD